MISSNGVDAANTDTGLDNTKTYFTVDFVNTVNDDTAKETQDADATATILIGNTDENGDYYACVKDTKRLFICFQKSR